MQLFTFRVAVGKSRFCRDCYGYANYVRDGRLGYGRLGDGRLIGCGEVRIDLFEGAQGVQSDASVCVI